MDAEVFVFVDIHSVLVSGVTKHNVRVAHLPAPLNDPRPNLALRFIAGDHRFHPGVAHRHAVGEFLDRIPFGTDIKKLHDIVVLHRKVRREVPPTHRALADHHDECLKELHEMDRTRGEAVIASN